MSDYDESNKEDVEEFRNRLERDYRPLLYDSPAEQAQYAELAQAGLALTGTLGMLVGGYLGMHLASHQSVHDETSLMTSPGMIYPVAGALGGGMLGFLIPFLLACYALRNSKFTRW